VGNRWGTKDDKKVVLDPAEFLVRVTHEKLVSVRYQEPAFVV
jgi:hypothetical protein